MTTLLLSGWSQPSEALLGLAPDGMLFDYSDYASAEESFAGLAAFKDVPNIIAWSLGGHLALRAIAAGGLAPKHVTLLAAPYQFVSDDKVKGMDPLIFNQFRQNYTNDTGRTTQRFHALIARGEKNYSHVLEQLRHHPEVRNTKRFLPWLDELGAVSLRQVALADVPRTLIIHGMNDSIVPHAQGEILAAALPDAQLNSWAEVGHAPHLHDVKRAIAEIDAHRGAA